MRNTQGFPPDPKKIIHASDNAGRGRLIVRFGDEALACLEQNIPTRSGEPLTRSGIGTVDSVLDELGVCSLERVFPLVPKFEQEARQAGLHRWYIVHFSDDTDLDEAALRLSALGEVKESTEPVTRGSVGNCPPRLL